MTEEQTELTPEVEETPEVVETEVQQQEAPAKDWSDDDEAEARLFGWKAPDEWQGEKPAGYIDRPNEFLERVQRSRIFQAMEGKLQQQESSFAETARKLEAMSERALETQKSQYEARMADVVRRQRAAVEIGDTDAYDKIEAERAHLLKTAPQEPPAAPEQPPGPDPEVAAYRQNNAWAQNPIIWREAAEAVNYMPGLSTATPVAEQLKYAEQVIKQKYPHLFNTDDRPAPKQRVEAGGLASSARKSAFDKIPAEAKSQFKNFVEMGIYKDTKEDRETYANEYANS